MAWSPSSLCTRPRKWLVVRLLSKSFMLGYSPSIPQSQLPMPSETLVLLRNWDLAMLSCLLSGSPFYGSQLWSHSKWALPVMAYKSAMELGPDEGREEYYVLLLLSVCQLLHDEFWSGCCRDAVNLWWNVIRLDWTELKPNTHHPFVFLYLSSKDKGSRSVFTRYMSSKSPCNLLWVCRTDHICV